MNIDFVSENYHESLIDLLCELHAYYNEGISVSREVMRNHLLETLLSPKCPHRLVVACSDDGQVLGLAAIMLSYSIVEPTAEKGNQCEIKELYVRLSERSKGVGRKLMSWIAKYAADNNCCRIDWPVKASNSRGIDFYESLGAKRVFERLIYRLSGQDLIRSAAVNDFNTRNI